MRRCSIDGCRGKHWGRGWCRKHHARWLRHGDPLYTEADGSQGCSVDRCEADHHAKGMCNVHYYAFVKHGDPTVRLKGPLRDGCEVEGCERRHDAHGFCAPHYKRWRRYGDPLAGSEPRSRQTPEERFWRYFKPNDDGCWIWQSGDNGSGYGKIHVNGDSLYAHRYGFELFRGPIPEGLVLDHLCENPPCVNPWHLEPVTHQENIRRAHASRREAKIAAS